MRKSAKTFKDLIVWQKAHEFVLAVYKYTNKFPNQELYGLILQFRHAAVSTDVSKLLDAYSKAILNSDS